MWTGILKKKSGLFTVSVRFDDHDQFLFCGIRRNAGTGSLWTATGILNKEKDLSHGQKVLVDGLCFVCPMILAVLMSSFFPGTNGNFSALAGGRSEGQIHRLLTSSFRRSR